MQGEWFKKAGVNAAAYLLALVLLATSSAAVFHFVIADPGKIKGTLKDSGVYNSFVEAVSSDIIKREKNPKQQPGEQVEQPTIQLKDPAIQKAVQKAFSPKVLQTSAEKVIDGTYAWLDGTTEQPKFTLDFTKNKQTLAEEIGTYAKRRASKLPPCSFQEIPAVIDPLKMKCLPPGITPAQIGAKTKNDLLSDKNLLPETKITQDNLFGGKTANSQENPFNQQGLPSQFRLMKNLFWILVVLAAGLAAAAVWLSQDRLKGIEKASKSFLAVGVFLAITPLLLGFFSSRLAGTGLFSDPVSRDLGLPIMNEFIGAISTVYYVFGAVCILIGLAGFIATRKLKKPGQPAQPTKING